MFKKRFLLLLGLVLGLVQSNVFAAPNQPATVGKVLELVGKRLKEMSDDKKEELSIKALEIANDLWVDVPSGVYGCHFANFKEMVEQLISENKQADKTKNIPMVFISKDGQLIVSWLGMCALKAASGKVVGRDNLAVRDLIKKILAINAMGLGIVADANKLEALVK